MIPKDSGDWRLEEKSALVQSVLLHSDGSHWIFMKKASLWENAVKFLSDRCGSKRASKYTKLGMDDKWSVFRYV